MLAIKEKILENKLNFQGKLKVKMIITIDSLGFIGDGHILVWLLITNDKMFWFT